MTQVQKLQFQHLLPYDKEREMMHTNFSMYEEYKRVKVRLIEQMCEEFNCIAKPLWSVHCSYVGYGIILDLRMATIGGARLAIDSFRYHISTLLGIPFEKVEDEQQLSFEELTSLFEAVETYEFDNFNFKFAKVVFLRRYPVAIKLVPEVEPPLIEYLKPALVYIHLRPDVWESEYEMLYNAQQYLKALQTYLNYLVEMRYQKNSEYEQHIDP